MRIFRPAGAWIMGVVFLGGCAVGPKYQTPPAPVPDVFKEAPADSAPGEEWKVATPQDAMRRGTWWEMFNDPELNALEEQLTSGNQNIAQAYENYMEARALVGQARAQRVPTVTAAPNVQRSQSSATLGLGTSSAASGGVGTGRPVNEFALPITAS